MSSPTPDDPIILTSGWPSYVTLSVVPLFLMAVGLSVAAKTNFGMAEIVAFYVLPALAEAGILVKLRSSRIELSHGNLVLQRFVFHSLSLRKATVTNDAIIFGVLSNGLTNKFAIEKRSGLKIVPVSVLYLEYRSGQAVEKLAFDVSSLDNRKVSEVVGRFPKVSQHLYGRLPSL